MKKILLSIVSLVVALVLFACDKVSVETQVKNVETITVSCVNGNFVGNKIDGIMSFKGIPYAKPPIGNLRWKAPVPLEPSDDTFDATKFGKSAFQLKASSEQASMNPEGQSEDCLTLNIWSADNDKKK